MYQSSAPAEPGSEPAAAVAIDQTADPESADAPESGHAFRDELARAMHAAADHERLRIEATVDEDATAHIDKVRLRALAEAGELKRLAEDDVTGIRSWAKSEIERIRAEADVQINERRERLEQHLIGHATIIDGEVDRVSEAIEGYRHELAAFFVRLSDERDPTEIARLADTVPAPPDFEVIRAVARAEAVDRLSRLETDEASSTEASTEAAADAGTAAPTGSAGSAGDVVEADREPVGVMDPALAVTDEPAADAGAETAETGEAAQGEVVQGEATTAELPTADAPAADAPAADVPAADMAATAGEPADEDEAAEPVAVAAGSASDSNPAARFLRSITSWGSSDHGNGDEAK
jgi:hypothetical protein